MHDALAHVMAATSTPRDGRIQGRDLNRAFIRSLIAYPTILPE